MDVLRHAYLEGSRRLAPVDQLLAAMLQNAPDPFKAMVGYDRQIEVMRYGKAFIFEHERDDNDQFHSVVKRCFWHDFFHAQGVSDLTAIFCDVDNLWMDALKRGRYGVRCDRPTTLGYGSDACRFQFIRVPR
jgi:hypothetical protein